MNKNIFSFDAETDGLYGDIFAIGAVVMSPDGIIVDQVSGASALNAVADEWCVSNIVPLCTDLPEFSGRRLLRDAFWHFWMNHRDTCICLADFGAPVEAYLFRLCIEEDNPERLWLGPYPMHELGTVLLDTGVDPDVNRREYAGMPTAVQHNPLQDAIVAARCYLRAISSTRADAELGRLVRAMPVSGNLYHYRSNKWVYTFENEEFNSLDECTGDTPEAALRAALGEEEDTSDE